MPGYALSANKPPREVYDLLLDESGGPMKSNSMSQEPRDLKILEIDRV